MIQEEMWWVLETFQYQADWWESQIRQRTGLSPDTMEGLSAYAIKQASLRQSLHSSFFLQWSSAPELASLSKGTEREMLGLDLDPNTGILSPPRLHILMASMYLLKHTDHYTDHTFHSCFWKSSVTGTRCSSGSELTSEELKVKDQVVIDRRDGEYIAYSTVDNYKFRPEHCKSMSLYDWVRRANKYKLLPGAVPKDKSPMCDVEDDEVPIRKSGQSTIISKTMQDSTKYQQREQDALDDGLTWAESNSDDTDCINRKHMLLEGHSQADTHGIKITMDNRLVVLNFIGGSLPRADKGNHKYYCCTMMTLFMPWQSGLGLKGNHMTWDDTFNNANFSKRDRTIMKNMNVCYEYLDVRDDYSEKMHKTGFHPDRGILGHLHLDKVNQTYEEDSDFTCDMEDANVDYETMGEEGRKITASMLEIEDVVKEAGWLMPSQDGLPEVDVEPVEPHVIQTAARWDNSVAALRNKYVEEKMQHALNVTRMSHSRKNPDPFKNDAKVVNRLYLVKVYKYNDKRTEEIVSAAAKTYTLNPEQECMFRTIANHAITEDMDQLKMYIVLNLYAIYTHNGMINILLPFTDLLRNA